MQLLQKCEREISGANLTIGGKNLRDQLERLNLGPQQLSKNRSYERASVYILPPCSRQHLFSSYLRPHRLEKHTLNAFYTIS